MNSGGAPGAGTMPRHQVPMVAVGLAYLGGPCRPGRTSLSYVVMTDNQRRVLAEGKYLRLVAESGWEWVERLNASGAAVIAALTDDRRLVLVEQYRIPLHARVLDLPAGLVGDEPGAAGEAMIDAARRELFEETGYEGAAGACAPSVVRRRRAWPPRNLLALHRPRRKRSRPRGRRCPRTSRSMRSRWPNSTVGWRPSGRAGLSLTRRSTWGGASSGAEGCCVP